MHCFETAYSNSYLEIFSPQREHKEHSEKRLVSKPLWISVLSVVYFTVIIRLYSMHTG